MIIWINAVMKKNINLFMESTKEVLKDIEDKINFELIETKNLLYNILEKRWNLTKQDIDYIKYQIKDILKISLYIPGFILPWWLFWILWVWFLHKKWFIKCDSHNKVNKV